MLEAPKTSQPIQGSKTKIKTAIAVRIMFISITFFDFHNLCTNIGQFTTTISQPYGDRGSVQGKMMQRHTILS